MRDPDVMVFDFHRVHVNHIQVFTLPSKNDNSCHGHFEIDLTRRRLSVRHYPPLFLLDCVSHLGVGVVRVTGFTNQFDTV